MVFIFTETFTNEKSISTVVVTYEKLFGVWRERVLTFKIS